MMKKLNTQIAVVVMMISLLATAPGVALADGHHKDHGPRPVAIVGTIFGGAMWLISTPFTALFAPKQIMKSFDTMVAEPWRTTIGSDK